MNPRATAFLASAIVFAGSVRADTYDWNGATTGGASGIDNNWNTATANWTGFGTIWPTVSTLNDDANFGGTAGVVTLITTVTANDITFATGGYTVGIDDSTGVIILDGTDPSITLPTGSLSNIGAVLQGSAGLIKAGPSTLQLRGVNTYSGDTRVLRGNLLIGRANNRLPTATKLILGDPITNTSGVFQMNSRSQQVAGLETAGTGTGNRVINSSPTDSTFTVANTTDQTFGGILGGTGSNDNNFNFTKAAAGKLVLTSTNTHTGTTTISGGTLELGHATNTLADTAPVNVSGGTLDITDKTETIGALTVTSGTLAGTTGVLSAPSCAGKSGTVSAVLAGTANLSGTSTIWLTKDTAGTLTLAAANTFTGNISIGAGRLTLANSGALGIADPTPGGTNRKGIMMQGTSRSLWLKGGITIPSSIDFYMSSNSGDGGGINNESDDNEIQSPISFSSGNPALNISSAAGRLTVSGNITMTQTARTLYLGGASEDDNTISGDIAEKLSNGDPNPAIMPLIKQGAGKWILSGTNTYKGDTDVRSGTLVLASGGSQAFYPKSDGTSNKITDSNDPLAEPVPVEGAVTLGGALQIDLTDAVTASSWPIVDVNKVAETYGPDFTVAGFAETSAASGVWKKTVGANVYTFTESDGLLTRSTTSTPFQLWMSNNFPSITAPDNDPEDDPDGDGVNNLAEFAFSGNPGSGSDQGIQRFGIEAVSGNDHLTYTFACRSGAVFTGTGPAAGSADGVRYTVRATTDLTNFALGLDEVDPAILTGLPVAPSGYTYRTFRVTSPRSANHTAFIQVKSEAAP